jgi:hypothetical protein
VCHSCPVLSSGQLASTALLVTDNGSGVLACWARF